MANGFSSPAICNEINNLLQLRLCDGRQHRRCGRQRCRPGLALLLRCMLLLPWKGACYKCAIAANAILQPIGSNLQYRPLRAVLGVFADPSVFY